MSVHPIMTPGERRHLQSAVKAALSRGWREIDSSLKNLGSFLPRTLETLEAVEAERDALKEEVGRLNRRLAMQEDALAYWQRISHRFRVMLCDGPAVSAASREDWYAAERHHFETAYAATKEARR